MKEKKNFNTMRLIYLAWITRSYEYDMISPALFLRHILLIQKVDMIDRNEN